MPRLCELTGKRPNYGNNVSHAKNRTRTRWELNLRSKKYTIPELGRTMQLYLSTRAIRTVDKLGGIVPVLMKAKPEKLSFRLLQVRTKIQKQRRGVSRSPSSQKNQPKTT